MWNGPDLCCPSAFGELLTLTFYPLKLHLVIILPLICSVGLLGKSWTALCEICLVAVVGDGERIQFWFLFRTILTARAMAWDTKKESLGAQLLSSSIPAPWLAVHGWLAQVDSRKH